MKGQKTDGHTPSFTTNPVDSTSFVNDFPTFTSADIPLKARREEDGREQSRIGAKLTVETDNFSNHVTIKQDKEAHNVIRQEYEDVKHENEFAGFYSPREIDFPNSSKFSKSEMSLDFAQQRNKFPAKNTKHDAYVAAFNMIDGLKKSNLAIDSLQVFPNTKFCPQSLSTVSFGQCRTSNKLYDINSHYRSPSKNKQISGIPISRHLIGKALDLDAYEANKPSADVIQPYFLIMGKPEANNQEALCELLKSYGANNCSFYQDSLPESSDGDPTDWHVHVGWPRSGGN